MSFIDHRIYRLMDESKERELSTLRHRLFESHWTTADYKAMLRDEVMRLHAQSCTAIMFCVAADVYYMYRMPTY